MKQVLCINRKGPDMPVLDRQAAFVNRFAEGCNGKLLYVVTEKQLKKFAYESFTIRHDRAIATLTTEPSADVVERIS